MTWTVKNDFNKPVTLSNIKITPNAGNGNVPATIQLQAGAGSSFKTTFAGTTKADLVLSVDGLWQDGPGKTWPDNGKPKTFTSEPVKLKGDCKPTGSSPSPSPSPSRSASKPPTPEASHPATPTPSQSSTPGLPVTGSNTTLPMVGTGAALVAGGAALVFTLRRRRRVTFTAE
ncbi:MULTISPECIES: LPXTG cell wall anchor domain-containing protein [Dactylosporangium]|uniref:LPXTG cell wall anchor domain-containing protein n=1 Tax=Dactylosporangium vinaceum TaxID=53362 RepID=A0ABV5M6J3_9ACTN|nr:MULTISPECIES: LPXTG cell wall anchor domain-containing protein [Dactylosporangium]UAB97879.1 LPXTG cell wall anchor domain-containing protein [Dactylosporangium vinaceum]UWZ46117.1 LPXTG cell wall anchor domain-containing protein [Dactylosporangium matsuzakiense]